MNTINTAQHTPGPWFVHNHSRPFAIYAGPKGHDDSVARPDAILGHVFKSHVNGHQGQQIANAHLIAAAPELLDALELALHSLECGLDSPCIPVVRAAIAKAKGNA